MNFQKRTLRALFFLFLLTCLLSGLVGVVETPVKAAPQLVPSTTIVISQVYGGAGCGTAGCSTYKNDYIELHNIGNSAVLINGWSIQYAAAGSTTWQVTILPNVSIAAGQYYLIAEAFNTNGVSNLPTPDTTDTIAMSATAGKVALVNTTTPLTGSNGCPFTASVIDFIGYGTTANCSETANAPAPSTTTADLRNPTGDGCTDTDNNSGDFLSGTPTPRNTNSIGYICGVGTYTPTSTSTNTSTPTDTSTPTATFTPSFTPIFSLTPSITPIPGEVIISEVAWSGTQASSFDEWIELYNTRNTPIDLTGWRLVNFIGSVDIVINGVIPANGFFLFERARDLTVKDVIANQIYSGALGDTGDSLTLSMSNGTVVDTANNDLGAWTAGVGFPNFNSMDRVITGGVPAPDTASGWVSNTNAGTWTKHDAAGNLIHGTPAGNNWGFTVTVTSTPTATGTATNTATPTRTPTGLVPATNIVISEIQTIGPNGGSDEFIELYNPTSSAISVGNWIIKKSSGCGTTVSTIATIPSAVTLVSGQHYLIGGSSYSGSVIANLSASLGVADNGGIALFYSDGITIIDEVGLCSSTLYREGATLAPLTTNTNRSYDRKSSPSGSCVDTDNNAVDFILRNPSDPQNLSSPLTKCGNPTPTPTPTATHTNTPTRTNTPGLCGVGSTPTSIIINEVAWSGTAASTSDEWIELYNPTLNLINLDGWVLRAVDGTPNIQLSNVDLLARGYYLLERTDDTSVVDVPANQFFNDDIENSSEVLQLYDARGLCVDTANSNGASWPAGSSVTFGTMERRGVVPDSDTAWITNVNSASWTKHDANGNLIHGTPGYGNWAFTVTVTPSPVPTLTKVPTKFKTATPAPLPPPPLIGINEFVPRPGHDWNNDGVVNVGDEYIELINHGVIDVNLSGYTLDDEANIGSDPYRLPSVTLKPGERMVFYGMDTGLLLSDGGDGVRLIKPNGQLGDAYNYTVVKYPDQSYCRLPDNGGLDDWNTNCFPTPGLQNALSGNFARPPTEISDDKPLCPISDVLPVDFVWAECPSFGNIWSRFYWDVKGWFGEKSIPDDNSKWDVYVD